MSAAVLPSRADPPSRIVTLDGLRGLAVMGILVMNVNAFAMPFPAYDNPAAYGPMRPADLAVWAAAFVAVDGKMRAIFSALFGASLLLVAERAAAAGRSVARVHYARMATLLLFGFAHAGLVWEGDILALYALVGMAAFPLRALPVERLLVLAGMLLLFGAGVLGLHYQALAALAQAAAAPGAAPGDVAIWRDVLDQIAAPRRAALAADLALHRGGWAPLAAAHIAQWPRTIVAQLLFDGPETLGLMLLGMAGLRSGFLAGRWPPARYARAAAIGLAIGLPPSIATAWWLIAHRFPPLATTILVDLASIPARWALAIAEAALLVRWLARARGALACRIAAAGRVAFTNYLGTSLVMTALFDGWGIGLYGRVGRAWLLVPVLAVWGLMLAWSRPWLARFRYGPLEWLWRSLARGELQLFRGQAVASKSQ